MEKSLKTIAKDAKTRLKNGFWENCRVHTKDGADFTYGRVGRLMDESTKKNEASKEEEFYKRVKEILQNEGEVSDAIGRLTDYKLYDSLNYDEKQLYTLELSERYLKAVKRFYNEQRVKC